MTAKDLKNALLQEAVQGKLVPQIANEGNARDLLEEIRKERGESLPLASARKRSSATPSAGSKAARFAPITEDEIPFEIPESWCWCRLGEIAEIKSSKRVFEKDYVHEGVPFFRSKEIGDLSRGEGIHTELFITEKHYEELRCNYGVPQVEDILLTSVGSIGNYWICDGREFYYKDGNVTQICHNDFFETKYFTSFLSSPLFYEQVNSSVAGTAYNALTIIKLKSLLFPLPPLAEQKRIVAAIEKFMPLIEEYGKKETELKAFNEQIGTLTKKAILQEAVQGKLVPQIAAEGNAKDLLVEIRKERLSHGLDFDNAKSGKRKSKKETALAGSNPCDISDDEIPENWCWCRLGEIVPFGVCQNAEPQEINDKDWILDLEDIEKDSGKILSFKTKKEVDSRSTKHIFKKGFVLYSKLRPYLNKCVIAPKDGFCTSEILPLDFGDMIYNKYAQLYLMSPFFVDYTNSLSFGVKMPRLGTEDGRKALFPLPPLAEQKRIVAAIEKMLPLCEKLGE